MITTRIIVFTSLCHLAYSYQMTIPADFEKGDFLGCYMDLRSAKNKDVEGVHRNNECIDICNEKYFRYAMVHSDGRCMCGNYLGDIKSSQLCKEFCARDCGDMQDQILDIYNTAVRMNGPPRNLLISNVTDTNAILTWKEPESFLNIEQYRVVANVVQSHLRSQLSLYSSIITFSNDTFRVHLVTLHPGTKYNVTVQADGFQFPGTPAYQVIDTLIGEPDASPNAPTILSKDDTTMVIKMEPVYNNNGPVSSYLIVVIEANAVQAVQTENLKSYRQANADGILYYVAAEIQPNRIDEPFIIGDSKVYGKYFNAPLQKDKNYHVMLGMLSKSENREFLVYSDTAGMQVDVIMSHMPNYEAGESSTVILLLSLAIVVISLLLVVGLIGFYFLRNRIVLNHRQRLNDNQELTIQGPMIDVENNGYIPEDELPQSSNHYKSLKERVWTIPQKALTIDQSVFLGYGQFGRMHGGTVLKNEQLHNVGVYCIKDKKMQPRDKRNMLMELDLIIKTSGHPNVLDLIGTCDHVDSVTVVLEQSTYNLKEYLLSQRTANANSFTLLPEGKVIDLAWSISKGMEHLHLKKIVHKQLCATHIAMVGSQAKIAGFGLAKYYKNEYTPNFLRHTAMEIFRGQDHSIKSDVWSFAVVLWEICALGATPYGKLLNDELPEKIIKGNLTLPQLPYVYDTLYQVMLNCWQLDWDERPTFAELNEHVEFIRNEDCLSFSMYPGFQYEGYYPELESSKSGF